MRRRSRSSGDQRPTHKELTGKIKKAKECLKRKQWAVDNPPVFREDIGALGISTYYPEQVKALNCVLNEIHPDCYAGSSPPEESYRVKGAELFVFIYDSEYFGQKIYFKFAICKEKLIIISLHKNRKKHGA